MLLVSKVARQLPIDEGPTLSPPERRPKRHENSGNLASLARVRLNKRYRARGGTKVGKASTAEDERRSRGSRTCSGSRNDPAAGYIFQRDDVVRLRKCASYRLALKLHPEISRRTTRYRADELCQYSSSHFTHSLV